MNPKVTKRFDTAKNVDSEHFKLHITGNSNPKGDGDEAVQIRCSRDRRRLVVAPIVAHDDNERSATGKQTIEANVIDT
jgi:hypothetical protein